MGKGLRFIFILVIIGIIVFGAGRFVKGFILKDSDDLMDSDLVESHGIDIDYETVDKQEVDVIDGGHNDTEAFKYTTDNLNLRTGPGSNYDVLFTIPVGEKVVVIDHENGWDKIVYKGSTGYSSDKYLSDERIEKPIDNNLNVDVVEPIETMKVVKGILLVNKEYGLSMDYNPGEDPEARECLDKLLAACYEEIGKKLTAFSGYRTYEYQKGLFNKYVKKEGYDKAVMYSAKPRHSEHETGLAFDIGGSDQSMWLKTAFEDTDEGVWLRENAHRFGFILRYPKGKTDITGYIYEPWHFRYVGIEHATNIFEKDITLEEYLLGVN